MIYLQPGCLLTFVSPYPFNTHCGKLEFEFVSIYLNLIGLSQDPDISLLCRLIRASLISPRNSWTGHFSRSLFSTSWPGHGYLIDPSKNNSNIPSNYPIERVLTLSGIQSSARHKPRQLHSQFKTLGNLPLWRNCDWFSIDLYHGTSVPLWNSIV